MSYQISCSIRVKDVEKIDLIRFLESINRSWIYNKENLIICLSQDDMLSASFPDNAISCGENIELFKALVAVNDENDYQQMFTDGTQWHLCTTNTVHPVYVALRYHKASKEEIILYYKNKYTENAEG